jgi:3-dehydroquinate synthase
VVNIRLAFYLFRRHIRIFACNNFLRNRIFYFIGSFRDTEIIRKTALYKCAVVERDAFEKGERRLLNLGHTFAHAIEKNCPIMHGEAVAIGLVLAAGVSERLGLAPAGLAVGLAEDLKKVGLPTQSPIAIGVLLEALEKDKKVEGDAIHFILPRAVGEVVDRAIPLKQLEEVARDLR